MLPAPSLLLLLAIEARLTLLSTLNEVPLGNLEVVIHIISIHRNRLVISGDGLWALMLHLVMLSQHLLHLLRLHLLVSLRDHLVNKLLRLGLVRVCTRVLIDSHGRDVAAVWALSSLLLLLSLVLGLGRRHLLLGRRVLRLVVGAHLLTL